MKVPVTILTIRNKGRYKEFRSLKPSNNDLPVDAVNLVPTNKNGYFKKCILSRVKQETYNVKNAFDIFKHLCDSYSHGFKYILNHAEYGLWVGVSPEILIHGNSTSYQTQALAGSKEKNDNKKWGNKEINEHQYVTDYIREIIKSQGKLEYESSSEEFVAGNIKHLNQKFKFKQLKVKIFID